VPTSDDYARAVIAEGKRRGITERGVVIALATVLVESGYPIKMWANYKVPESLDLPHDAVGSDGLSCGLFQQQVRQGANGQWWWGSAAQVMDPATSAGLFYDRLARLDYNDTSRSPGSYAQDIQRSAFPARYDQRMDDAQEIYDRLAGTTGGEPVPDYRPDFNEINQLGWDADNPHGSVRSRPPINFFIHTEEPGGSGLGPSFDDSATRLAAWLRSTTGNGAVSYHYTTRQATDGGVTVVDVIDTDLYSWSVLNANVFSINLCFAGSKASWSREQWMTQAKAIDVAAYLAVQDCRKYNFSTSVIAPPYGQARPGISDHKYVTQCLGIGTHTDVGNNFPWDVFAAAVGKYVNAGTPGAQPPPVLPKPPAGPPDSLSDRQLLEDIWEQLRGDNGEGWKQLGTNDKGQNLTLVDAVAKLLKESAP
jgi:hypothetical protein